MRRVIAVVEVEFTIQAKVELAALLDFIHRQPFGNPARRYAAIEGAIEILRAAPEGCRVFKVVGDRAYRVLVVESRILIPYIYVPDPNDESRGTISVRAVRHSAMRHPLRAVREVPRVPYGSVRSLQEGKHTGTFVS